MVGSASLRRSLLNPRPEIECGIAGGRGVNAKGLEVLGGSLTRLIELLRDGGRRPAGLVVLPLLAAEVLRVLDGLIFQRLVRLLVTLSV